MILKLGNIILLITLLFEAGLLFVAANTGFLAGPSVLANMAIDGWMPNRFRHLSTRLSHSKWFIFIWHFCISAFYFGVMAKFLFLVVLYSINVFITFSLSLFGLCVYWAKHRSKASPNWFWRLVIFIFCFSNHE